MKRARTVPVPSSVLRARLRRPMWRSLASRLAWQIDLGTCAPGARVPAIRTLARQLRVSRTTVTLAYEWLVAEGYLESRVGDGSYVSAGHRRSAPPLWQRRRRWLCDPDGLTLYVAR